MRPPSAPRRRTAAPALRLTGYALAALAVLAQQVQAQGLTAVPAAEAASTAKPGKAARPATRSGAKALDHAAPVTLNFVNADIEAVTRAIAAMIDRQILVDPRVKGTITVYSEQAMPVREAYLNYLAALRGLGFTLVDTAGLLKVVPEADAKLQTGTVSVGPVEQRGDQVLTQIFRLNHENPNNLVAVLRPLISPNNTINANPGNSTLVITDYASNLARLAKIIAALDQPAAAEIEVVPLRHAVAADLAQLVQKLGESSGATAAPGAAAAGAGSAAATVMVEPRSNALIVRTANPARMAALRTLIERLDQPGADGPAGAIHVVHLRNADAVKLATVLRAAFGGGASSGSSGSSGSGSSSASTPSAGSGGNPAGGSTSNSGANSTAATTPVAQSAQPSTGGFIQADPATNSLIISAPAPLYRQMRGVIEQLDGRRAQVYIESMIVEMDATKAAELGFQWQGLLGSSGDKYGVFAGTNFGTSGSNLLSLTAAAATGSASSLVSSATNGLNVGLIQKIGGTYTLGALARFLETVSGTNILSTPNLMAMDNEEAKIVIGQNVPFVTGSYSSSTSSSSSSSTVNPFQTIERKDVGLTLKVKPQIGEGGTIRMVVYQENSAVVSSSSSNVNGPTTNKNAIETTVTIDDGAMMVLGGQLKDQYDGGEDKIPLLGDMPVVGNLFRSENRKRQKTVLLVFLRPVVLRDARAAESLTLDRYEAIRAQQQAAQPAPSKVLPINEAPQLPALPAKPAGDAAAAGTAASPAKAEP